MKYLIFDAGPIISLTMNGLLPVLERLRENFDGEFIITPPVKREIVDRPMKIKKFKLEALKVQEMIDRGVLKSSGDIVSNQKLSSETRKIMNAANEVLKVTETGEKIKIIHEGEAACLAFANLCKCDNAIVIDERTTRMLIEAPKDLESMMERKLHTPLDSDFERIHNWKKFRFIRSAELLFIALKKNLIWVKKSKELLDALLYGVKFKGCAISSVEIEDMKRLAI